MRTISVLALLCAAALVANTARAAADDNVLVLTDDTFDAKLADVQVALVEFYAPWCGHCKALEPKYNEAADKITADPELAHVKLAKIDADAAKKIPGKFGVSGFPTIKLFRNGQFAEDYEGGRTTEDIVAYMKKKGAVAVNKEITTLTALKKLTAAKSCPRTTVVGFFSDKTGVDYKYFSAVAAQFASSGIDIYHTSAPSVLEGFGFFSSGSSIQMYRPGQKPFKVTYRGTIFKQQLSEWILKNALPPYGIEYTPENEGLFKMHGASVVRFVTSPSKYSTITTSFLEKLSQQFPTINFAVADKEHYGKDVEAHCEKKNADVCMLATEGAKAKKTQGRVFGSSFATFSEDEATKFVQDFSEQKLKVRVKSEAAPAAAPKAGEVAVAVGTTFESIVADESKDVFIEFYAPWCGHCKALAPKYEQLAKELEDEFDNILIAKLDMTANELPGQYSKVYEVSGFPTLYFAPKGKKLSPIKYDGGRDVAEMKKWILEKRTPVA